jgi:protein-disulfide isomerase
VFSFLSKKWRPVHIVLFSTLVVFACTQGVESKSGGPNYVKKDPPAPGLVAKINGKDISAEDLEKANPDVFSSRLEHYQTQKRAIDEMVRQSVLEELAKKSGKSVDAFVAAEMEKAKKKISDKEVAAFLKDKVAKPEDVPAHIKDQVRGMLYMQNLVADNTKKAKPELYLQRPKAPAIDFNLKGEPSWGNENAAVTIVEFSDFQCPYCAKGRERVSELKKEYGKKIHIVYKNFPLPMHPDARPSAEAAMCVNDQGADKFWKYHDMLFDHQDKLSAADLKEYAKKVGVDEKKFQDCFDKKAFASHIDATMEEARKLGVNSTPSFYVNGFPIRGARDISEFKEIIDDALAAK